LFLEPCRTRLSRTCRARLFQDARLSQDLQQNFQALSQETAERVRGVQWNTLAHTFATVLYVSTFLLHCTFLLFYCTVLYCTAQVPEGLFCLPPLPQRTRQEIAYKARPAVGSCARASNPEFNSTHKRYPRARRAKLSISGLEQAGGKRMARPFLNICLGSVAFGNERGEKGWLDLS